MQNDDSPLLQEPRIQASVTLMALVAGAYVGIQLISNVASLKIANIATMALDMGAFCYPLSFILRDLAHRVLGKRAITNLIYASVGINLFASLYLGLCSFATPISGEPDAFRAVFTPMWRLVFASLLAMLVSGLCDTQIYHALSKKFPRSEWIPVLGSNIVSIPVDNLLFAIGAFAWSYSWTYVWQIFLLNLLVKIVVGLVGTPLIYLLPKKLRAGLK